MNKNLNILMLNYEFPPIGGGAGRAHWHLLKEYAKHPNLTIDVLTASHLTETIVEQFSDNIRIHRIGLHKKNLHYWKKTEILEWLIKARPYYRWLVQTNRYDLVHSFFAFPSGALCLKTAGRIPYIISLRGSDVPGFNSRLKLDYVLLEGLFRKIWRCADAVVANSSGLAALAKRFEPAINYQVIPNGIDIDTFCPPPQRTMEGRVKLLTVCRLIGRKRIHLLIEALAYVLQQKVDAELTIVGEGNLQNELQQLAGRLGVSERVRFAGLVACDKLPAVYREHDLFLMSSEHEGMSNAMLEAMASGLPIVTTACEGSDELIGANGVIVPEPNPQMIAEAAMRLIRQPETYRQMAAASRLKGTEFSWETVANRYRRLYDFVLNKTSYQPMESD